ncbi:hypothetical protein NBT05_06355 [Aquimarina sp. ERC-38]|uniref:hypothetical protein n=1 Tax=Aquimarina sp. ERC-38 TaxID=2949996 RepID=UPI002245185A|nr:hypothetical protein [Aquimarina sp. ERC-38]UZO82090.1 hypothetical protein NBT05_06355 [Aquimarina sp. ERC-38]
MNFRSGYYGIYKGKERKLIGADGGIIIKIENNTKRIKLNHQDKKEIQSAYSVSTFCNYKSGKYFIENISNQKVLLNPDFNTLIEILGRHPYDHGVYRLEVTLEEFNKNVSSIWEEREKLSNFPFKVEKIEYLKK